MLICSVSTQALLMRMKASKEVVAATDAEAEVIATAVAPNVEVDVLRVVALTSPLARVEEEREVALLPVRMISPACRERALGLSCP